MSGPAVKHDEIVGRIRQSIIDGDYPPGSQLPTRTKLEESFDASSVTIQRALDRLVDDGYVVPRGRNGTFVAHDPPHLSHYGVVFPYRARKGDPWPPFWSAIANEAVALNQSGRKKISLFYDVEDQIHSDAEDYRILLDCVLKQRLAGLFFVVDPRQLCDTPVVQLPGLPRVAICDREPQNGMRAIVLSAESQFRKSLAYFASRGRRKLAVIGVSRVMGEYEKLLPRLLKKYGMESRPYWIQGLDLICTETARNCVHLLMNRGQTERPDALYIADDNFLEHACKGLVESGVRVPHDVEVVAHCNFPDSTPSKLPVKRVGFDARTILAAALGLIDSLRRREEVLVKTRVDAILDHKEPVIELKSTLSNH